MSVFFNFIEPLCFSFKCILIWINHISDIIYLLLDGVNISIYCLIVLIVLENRFEDWIFV